VSEARSAPLCPTKSGTERLTLHAGPARKRRWAVTRREGMRRSVSHRPHLHHPHCSSSWHEPSATLRANSRHSPPRYTRRQRTGTRSQYRPALFESIARIEARPHLGPCPLERRFQAITSDGPEPLFGSARTAFGQTAQLPLCRRRRRLWHHAAIRTLVELLRRKRHARRTHHSAQPRGRQRVALTGPSTPHRGK